MRGLSRSRGSTAHRAARATAAVRGCTACLEQVPQHSQARLGWAVAEGDARAVQVLALARGRV